MPAEAGSGSISAQASRFTSTLTAETARPPARWCSATRSDPAALRAHPVPTLAAALEAGELLQTNAPQPANRGTGTGSRVRLSRARKSNTRTCRGHSDQAELQPLHSRPSSGRKRRREASRAVRAHGQDPAAQRLANRRDYEPGIVHWQRRARHSRHVLLQCCSRLDCGGTKHIKRAVLVAPSRR